ncbi:hypothetical protein BHU72_07625 [Desulfuribacillus stibiiarsenatis]|uniref:DUF3397 domain-containing protein n=1 Tax=Desulfuribacillus stibiiarsenatis TaxID=1390249 RepID=A0A1E5L435_9FIRM|nr:DUF3397 family protein [Desulfuribacillus stibiiarsenatis]OEH84699.1 hypothetical protein BHU72_07625 [Desulfuribacillus stibiiarsenatis]
MEFLAKIFAFILTLPFLAFFLGYNISKWFYQDNKKAFDIAIHVTTFSLFVSVSVMFQVVGYLQSGVFITLIIWITFLAVLIYLQWKLKNQIDIHKSLKGSLRLWFLVLCICYVALFIIGVTKSFI